ncbi:M48 family metallopeptidase [Pseudogulbenkiania sp. MAI-1]|uniref:M48 family metallopeptidase n=1 Tax=Pseudogulbenkiania sp. MAI-1 TaxID=990370 RepID=UPI00045E8BD0|nr:SprT family zinc-dependent metalloprotease [Pseudogulbenkiania sp. MAI-1]
MILSLPEADIPVTLVRRPRQSIGIRVCQGRVELIAHPAVPMSTLQAVLEKRREWIRQHWLEQQRRSAERAAQPFRLLLAGEPLEIAHVAGNRPAARQAGRTLQVAGVAEHERERLDATVAAWLRREAARRFPARLAELARLCRRQPASLALSSARTRWGSCSASGAIRLNWRLVQAPTDILDYVLAHELAHLVHMNHSAAFWSETERMFPHWRAARQWLKQHGDTLFAFG